MAKMSICGPTYPDTLDCAMLFPKMAQSRHEADRRFNSQNKGFCKN